MKAVVKDIKDVLKEVQPKIKCDTGKYQVKLVFKAVKRTYEHLMLRAINGDVSKFEEIEKDCKAVYIFFQKMIYTLVKMELKRSKSKKVVSLVLEHETLRSNIMKQETIIEEHFGRKMK